MAKNKRQREREKDLYVNARERALKHEKGAYEPAVRLPKGMGVFRFDRAKTYYLDIIPFVVGKGNPDSQPGFLDYKRKIYVHKTGKGGQTILCNEESLHKKCGCCDETAKMKRKHGNVDKETWSLVAPKEHEVFLVIDRENKKKKVQLFQTSYYKMFGELLDAELSELREGDPRIRFHSLEKGFTLEIRVKKGNWQGRAFNKPDKINIIPRDEPYGDVLINKEERTITFTLDGKKYTSVCVDDMVKAVDYEITKRIVRDAPSDEDEDDEEKDEEREDDSEDEEDSEDEDEGEDKDESSDEDNDGDEEDDEEEEETGKKKEGKALKLKVGMRVEHEEHGPGKITKVKGDSIRFKDDDGKTHYGTDPSEYSLIEDEDDEDEDDEEDDDSDDDEEDDDEDEDEDEDENEDEDEEDDEDEDEDEVKPKKKGKKKKKKNDDDDDEDIPF